MKLWGVISLLTVLIGCGSSVAEDKRSVAVVRDVKWSVEKQLGPKAIKLLAFVPYCEFTRARPRIEHIAKRKRPKGMVITVFVRFPPRNTQPKGAGCLGVGLGLQEVVKFRQPIGKRSLYDGSSIPPSQRWP
jgi:hypothetical protein